MKKKPKIKRAPKPKFSGFPMPGQVPTYDVGGVGGQYDLEAANKASAANKTAAGVGFAADMVGQGVQGGQAAYELQKSGDNKAWRKADNKYIGGEVAAAGIGAASGAASGALVGAAAGGGYFSWLTAPVGAVIGGAVGGTSQFFRKRSSDKREWKAQIEQENQKIAQDNANKKAQNDMANQMNYNQFRMGGSQPCYDCGGMHYAMGGVTKLPGGGYGDGTGQVENDENSVAPNGQFTQFNEPSHDQQNPNVPNASLAAGEKVFSAKLKMPGTKKSFAQLNKVNNTNKQDKVLKDSKATSIAVNTAKLLKGIKAQNSDMLFAAQEQLKQDKVKAYARRMGVELPDEQEQIHNPQEEQAEMMTAKYGGMQTLGYQDPRVIGGIDMTNPSSVQYHNEFGKYEMGGEMDQYKKGGRFMGINPAHKGYCTPMTKPTCTGHRRALALTLKKHHGFHEMGGVQKFGGGGTPTTNSILNIRPETKDELAQDDRLGMVTPMPLAYDPYYSSYIDPSTKEITPYKRSKDPEDMGNFVPSYKDIDWSGGKQKEQNKSNIPYGDIAAGITNLAGPIYGLATNKKPALQNYMAPGVRYVDPSAALMDQDVAAKVAKADVKNITGGNAPAYLSNVGQTTAANAMNKYRVQLAYDQANAGIYNANQPLVADAYNRSIDKRDMDLANYRNLNTKYIGDIGTGIASYNKQEKQAGVDQDYLDFIQREYPQVYAKYQQSKNKKG